MGNIYIRDLIAPNIAQLIADLQAQIDALKVAVIELDSRVDQNETDISELQTKVATLETQVAQLIDDLEALTLRVNQAEEDITQLQIDYADLAERVTQSEADISQLSDEITDIKTRLDTLEQYFSTKENNTPVVEITKSLNFTGDLVVAQDSLNSNQANINYIRPHVSSTDHGEALVSDTLSIDIGGDLVANSSNDSQLDISYTRPKIVGKDHNTDIVDDTLNINISGDLLASAATNQLNIEYTRPPITADNSGTRVVSDMLSINADGDLVASGSLNGYTISYTRPKLVTKLGNINIVTDSLVNNFTSTLSGDVDVTLSNTTQANVNIANQRHTVQNDSVDTVTSATVVNYSSDFAVTNPAGTTALVTCRSRAMDSPTRALNSDFIVSATRDAICTYTFSFSNTLSLSGGTSGSVDAQISEDGDTFTTQASTGDGITGGLVIGVSITQTNITPLTLYVPAGFTVRLQSSGSGATLLRSQEVLL